MLARLATRLPRGTRRCRRSPRATATSGNSGPPASPTPTLVAAVDDEHVYRYVSCARKHAASMSAMAINSRGIEAFAWVWGGGTCLMDGTGRHVAAADCRWPVRPTGGPSSSSPARGAVAPARRGLRDRLSEPVQIMRRPDSRLCVRCGRPKVEQAHEIIVPCSNVQSDSGR